MRARSAAFWSLLLLPTASWGGRPFVTDDASLTEAGACQVELWWQGSDATEEWWAVPACNPNGRFELTAGVTELRAGVDGTQSYLAQGKTLFRELRDGSYGFGLAFGVLHPESDAGGNVYVYAPFSAASRSGATVAHVNVGWLRDRESEADRATWGVAIGHTWADRVLSFVEMFGDHDNDPTAHLGLSFVVIPHRLHLDATYGDVVGGRRDASFHSIGVSVYPPAFRRAGER